MAALMAIIVEPGQSDEFADIYRSSWTKLLHAASADNSIVTPGTAPQLRCRRCGFMLRHSSCYYCDDREDLDGIVLGSCSCKGCANPYSHGVTQGKEHCYKLCDVSMRVHVNADRQTRRLRHDRQTHVLACTHIHTHPHAADGQQVCNGLNHRSVATAWLLLLQVTSYDMRQLLLDNACVPLACTG